MEGLDARRVDLVVAGSMFLVDRDGGVRARCADHLRVGAARRHRARRGRATKAPTRLVRRPACDPPGVGAEPRPPLQLAGGALAPGRAAVARALRRRCRRSTDSGPPTASCSSTPRSCTTSASTSPARVTTGTRRTSCATASSEASRPTRSSCSRRWCAGTAVAIPACPTSSRCSTRPRSRGSGRSPRCSASPTASTAAGSRRCTGST